jgi:hypothetical protein
MHVEYKDVGWSGKQEVRTKSVSEFITGEVLYDDENKHILERQAEKVCSAMGRLVEKLLEKGVFNLDDLKHIVDCSSYGLKADTLKLKEE